MEGSQPARTRKISANLARKIMDELGENVYLCYQCVKCTSGCPVAEYFDWQPNQILRALQLGQEDIVWQSKTPWLCASCQTCSTRCPQGIDITAIMEYLTREALQLGYKPAVSEVNVFNEAFMREIRLWGRAYEIGLMAEIKLRNHDLASDIDLAIEMLKRHKLAFLPTPVRTPRKVKPVPNAANVIAYYPGCSLHSTAKEFNDSTQAVCKEIGLHLVEPHGWVCCGSSAAHRADPVAALQLPLENLALMEQSGFSEVTMPCAACFNRHKTALHDIRESEDDRAQVEHAIGYRYQDSVQVSTLTQAILNHAGASKVAARTQKPLKDLKVVAYYGCLLTRPPDVTGAQHPDNPTDMDVLLSAIGAEVLDWSYKTTCCGAAHSLTRPDIVLKLSGRLLNEARRAGADLIAVACPLCHTNLDARQIQMNLAEPLPVMYITQLMALAFGLPEKASALHKNLVDPRPLLISKGLVAPPA
ncbi:MAG: CoB--CoM heterodisulfide reductase [Chloroflexi bacterium]|nr:CoB--CoM heterodisulfide reductase [Chloroflexota bacterium]